MKISRDGKVSIDGNISTIMGRGFTAIIRSQVEDYLKMGNIDSGVVFVVELPDEQNKSKAFAKARMSLSKVCSEMEVKAVTRSSDGVLYCAIFSE